MSLRPEASPQSGPADPLAADMRSLARQIFLESLAEASVEAAFERHVEYGRGLLRIADDIYDLSKYSRISVVAFGKGAHSMTKALAERLGPQITGIVSAPTAPPWQLPGMRYFQGGHPLPNAESVRAASAILRNLHGSGPRSLILYLISGGGSAMVEKPVDDDVSLRDLVATYRALVHSGAPIAEINAIRKHLSAVKGGRLAEAAREAQQVSILVSDVPENALDSLASGPTMPDPSTVEDCHAIVEKYDLMPAFPKSVQDLFRSRLLSETPKADHPLFHRSRWWPILSSASVQKPAVERAVMAGFAVEVDNSCDDWDYARAAGHLLGRLRELRRGVSRACLISVGEVTVRVTGKSGIGGRNQQFAVCCARQIAGENICVLSAGTDGIDGNSSAAGALADGTTVARARALGLDPEQAEGRFDAFPFFQALGDLILTGPTGNNLRDLRILLAY